VGASPGSSGRIADALPSCLDGFAAVSLARAGPVPYRLPKREREQRIQAARASDGSYAFVYSAFGRPFAVRMDMIAGPVDGSWYDPATGEVRKAGRFENAGVREFQPPKKQVGEDWVLVLDDASRGFPPPDTRP